jgi:RNA polymerase sigma-70 factor, ECF subfamily
VAVLRGVRPEGADPVLALIPTRANGQPAVATYLRDDDIGPHRAHGVAVLTVRSMRISRMVSFLDTGLFGAFGLPPTYPDRA